MLSTHHGRRETGSFFSNPFKILARGPVLTFGLFSWSSTLIHLPPSTRPTPTGHYLPNE